MNRIKSLLVAAALTCGVAIASAQTNPPAASPGFLNQQLGSIFGLYDTNVDYYSDANQFAVSTGLSYRSDNPGIQQEIEGGIYHHFGTGKLWAGPALNIDTLGQNGNNLDGLGGHLYLKYASHNIAGLLAIGYQRDIDLRSNAGELGFGAEGYVSAHVGIYAKYFVGLRGTGKNDTYGRLIVGANWKF